MNTKAQQRQHLLTTLKSLPPIAKQEADRTLITKLLNHPAYQTAQTIATYLSLPHEVATQELITQAIADGKTVLVPRLTPEKEMVFSPYHADQLETAAFGIQQPKSSAIVPKAAIDLIHVPGLGFHTDGYRLGYGGGYYDRYLQDYTGPTIATAYACQLLAFDPEPHDIPVKELLIDDII